MWWFCLKLLNSRAGWRKLWCQHWWKLLKEILHHPSFGLQVFWFRLMSFGFLSGQTCRHLGQEVGYFLRTWASEKEDASILTVTALPWFWELTTANEASWMLFPNSIGRHFFHPTKFLTCLNWARQSNFSQIDEQDPSNLWHLRFLEEI